ncbi:Uncharacterised protein [uncultured archaeon]|nr:Uncharacterised protein [uncultured archaeon]
MQTFKVGEVVKTKLYGEKVFGKIVEVKTIYNFGKLYTIYAIVLIGLNSIYWVCDIDIVRKLLKQEELIVYLLV